MVETPHDGRRFVGRETEIAAFKQILNAPYGEPRILFFEGPGGIGKTRLLEQLLNIARGQPGVVAVSSIIDFRVQDYERDSRVRRKIAEDILASLSSGEVRNNPNFEQARQTFKSFLSKAENSAKEFSQCLDESDLFKTNRPDHRGVVVLAFDTFEARHKDLVGRLLLTTQANQTPNISEEDILHRPGLICVIGSRTPPTSELDQSAFRILDVPLVQRMPVLGLTENEVQQLWIKRNEAKPNSSSTLDPSLLEIIPPLTKITKGHPLLVELYIDWLPGDLRTVEKFGELFRDAAKRNEDPREIFEKKMMQVVLDDWRNRSSDQNVLLEGRPLRECDYDTLMVMAYMELRLNERYLLEPLLQEGIIQISENATQANQIVTELGRKFPVKRLMGEKEIDISLHDEFRDLINKKLFENNTKSLFDYWADDPWFGFAERTRRIALAEAVSENYLKWIESLDQELEGLKNRLTKVDPAPEEGREDEEDDGDEDLEE